MCLYRYFWSFQVKLSENKFWKLKNFFHHLTSIYVQPPRTRLHQFIKRVHVMQTRLHQFSNFQNHFSLFMPYGYQKYRFNLISCEFGHLRGPNGGLAKLKKKKKKFFFALNRYFWSFEVKLSDNFFLKILKILKFITPTCPQGAPWRSYDPKCV